MTNQPSISGCATSLIGLGSLIAGLYHGLADAKGTPVDPKLENMLLYGPSIVGGITFSIFAKELYENNEMLQAQISQMPYEQRNSAIGCSAVMGGVVGCAAANGVGYIIGNFLGKSV
jgi:hypothetical protein